MTEISNKSILAKEIHGVVYVVGQRGLGKTLLAVQTDLPENILFLDFESKGQIWHEQLGFGKYVDVPSEVAAATPQGKEYKGRDIWRYVRKITDEIKPGQFTTCIIDTVGDLEQALADEIQYQPQLYGVRENQKGGGWGGIYPAMSIQISNFLSRLDAKGVRCVVVTAHTKPAWTNSGPVPNKLRAQGVNEWHDRSILELALIPGYSTVPSALVQKESLAGVMLDRESGTFTFKRRLPLKLPECTWGAINGYLKEPADLKNPKEGEVPTDDERLPYAEFFSKEQMEFLIKAHALKEDEG